MMKLKVILLILMIVPSVFGHSKSNYLTPPEDSADTENMRIWVPVERSTNCRIMIDIFDSKGQMIRQFINKNHPVGYYNYFWDKKDDNKLYVDEGDYKYRIQGCGLDKSGTLKVIYKKWERFCTVDLFPGKKPEGLNFTLKRDSALISIDIHYFTGKLIDKPIIDSVMNRGSHKFHWQPPESVLPGRYKVKIYVGDIMETFIIWNLK